MTLLKFILPFTYFFHTRVKGLRNFIFHGYFEWLPNILIIWLLGNLDLLHSIAYFLLSYVAFISVYELGYLINDHYSVKFEESPRKRFEGKALSKIDFIVLILVRVIIFLLITFYFGKEANLTWWFFYLILFVYFILHNVIKEKAYKILTFAGLAFCRFLAPVFIFLDKEQFLLLCPSILINYVLYRLLTYMDSKQLLNLPNRQEASFKLVFYILNLGISVVLSIFYNSMIPIFINLYYLFFMLIFYLKTNFFKDATQNPL